MKFGDNLLKARKKKGLSQEELGEKIGVTRQTISNWELGETGPNPKELKILSQELNISIDELLDNDIKNVLIEKVSNTEETTKLILRIIKMLVVIVVIVFLIIGIKKIMVSKKNIGRKIEESIYCKIYGEEHGFNIVYEELTGIPLKLGGDTYFSDILDLTKYNDANQIFNVINDYARKNNGSCQRILDHNLNNLVNVSIKENSLTNTGLTIIISENIDYNINYGEEFLIKKYNYKTNTYERIPEDFSRNCGFNDMAYIVKDKPLELKQDWSCMYGSLDKGKYLLVKDAIFESDIPINSNFNNIFSIWVEFEII